MPTPYITVVNWNVGGARILQLRSKNPDLRAENVEPPPRGRSREDVRAAINRALQELLRNKPDIVTLQEVVRYEADGNPETAEDVLNVEDYCLTGPNNVTYRYYPCWLVDNHRHSHQGKWNKVIRKGGWKTDPGNPLKPFFAQGNAMLVRDRLNLYPVWGVQDVGFLPPEDRLPGTSAGDAPRESEKTQKTKEAKGHRFIEHVPLQPGLYFGDRDTEPREASVAHFVLSELTRGRQDAVALNVPLDIFVVNVHLTTLTMERDGVPDVDMAGEHIRLRQLEIILKQIVSPYNRWRRECFPIRGDHERPLTGNTHTRHNPIWIIAGDFNFTPDSVEYDAMVRGGFIDLIPSVFKADPTQRPPTKASGTERSPTHTLDYVFAGPRFHAIDPVVADRETRNNSVLSDDRYGVSDHYPLLFRVPIEPNEPCECRYCNDGDGKKEK